LDITLSAIGLRKSRRPGGSISSRIDSILYRFAPAFVIGSNAPILTKADFKSTNVDYTKALSAVLRHPSGELGLFAQV